MKRFFVITSLLLAITTVAFAYSARHAFIAEKMLVGEWQYSYYDYFYPMYSSTLIIRTDRTYTKVEKYTARRGAETIVSSFDGPYTINGAGIEAGMIAFHFHNATARKGDEIVATSPTLGYSSICHYGFDVHGNLLMSEIVDSIGGNRKNPEDLPDAMLIPSFEHYRRITRR